MQLYCVTKKQLKPEKICIARHRARISSKKLHTICQSIWQDGRDYTKSFLKIDRRLSHHNINKIAMTEKDQPVTMQPAPTWYIYILSCRDNSYYTGITTDLSRRIEEHNSPTKGARYTRPRRPVKLVYSEKAASRSIATRRELQIKKLTPAGKKQLIQSCKLAKPGNTVS